MDTSEKDFEDLIAAVRQAPGSAVLARMLRDAASTPARVARLTMLAAALPPEAEALHELPDVAPVGAVGAKVFSLNDARTAAAPSPLTGFQSVGGLEHVKKQLRRRLIAPLRHQGLFTRFGKRSGGGLLLYGPPGCGKTMIVRAAAAEAQVRLLAVEVAQVLDSRVGWSEKRIVAAFDDAREIKPAILFFDEVEALASRRAESGSFQASLVSTFLNAFDGMAERNDGIFVAAATNTPWAVDPAFRRPGRFDRSLFVPPPNREARRTILACLLAPMPLGDSIDIDRLADRTAWFSGADLRALVESAADEAIEESLDTGRDVPLLEAHLLDALDEARPSTREWLATARTYAKYANEAGIYDEVLTFLDQHAR